MLTALYSLLNTGYAADLVDFFLVGEVAVDVVDGDAASLHAAKPCRLAFGILMDGGVELFDHVVVGEAAAEVEGKVLVFEAVE